MNDNAGSRGDDAYVGLMGLLTPWDLSRHPTANDLLRKLGKAGKTRAAAIVGVRASSGTKIWADGIVNKTGESSVGALDPDNWVPRYYESDEGDEFAVWSHRLVVDSVNPTGSKEQRSTQVVDAEGDQSWAWLADIARVTLPHGGSSVDDRSLWYNRAGFLPFLEEEIRTIGTPHRGVLATPIFRNIGHVTDGAHIGQWSHVFTFSSPGSPPVGTPQGNSTVKKFASSNTDEEVHEPPIQAAASGRPTTLSELLLRGDVKFRFPEGNGRLKTTTLPDLAKDSGEPRQVYLSLKSFALPEDVGLDTAQDANDNTVKSPKDAACREMVWWVKVPKYGGGDSHHYDDSYHHPPPENGDGSGGSFPPYGGYGDNGQTPPTGTYDPEDAAFMDEDGRTVYRDANGNLVYGDGTPYTGSYTPGEPSARGSEMGSRQVQSGFAPANSPAFTQRFNVHEYAADAFSVGSMVVSKPDGYTALNFEIQVRPSVAIPLGQEIELEIIAAPTVDGVPPGDGDLRAISVTFDSTLADDAWTRVRFRLLHFDPAETTFTLLFIRRNDLANPAPTVELWRRRVTVLSEV